MSPPRRFGSLDFSLLTLVLVAAAGARVGYLALGDWGTRAAAYHVQDPGELDALLGNLTEHRWFGSLAPWSPREEQTAHASPGYPWLLGWLHAYSPAPLERAVRWAQAALGVLTAGLYFLMARRAFGSLLVATLTGLFCALHPFWILNTPELQDGVLVTFLLGAGLCLGVYAGHQGGALTSLLYGATLGGLALVRAPLLVFAVAATLWYLLRCRTLKHGWLYALLAFLGFATALMPWAFRNYRAFGEALPVVNSTYYHLWMGNNPRADGGPVDEEALLEVLAEARGLPVDAARDQLGKLSQTDRYLSLGPDVLRQLRDDPAAAWRHRLEAGLAFFLGQRWLRERSLWQADESSGEALPGWLTQSLPAVAHGVLFGMLALGLLGWRRSHARHAESLPTSLALVWIPLPYLLSHAEALHGPRLPLDGLLLCYGAYALVSWIPGFQKRPGEEVEKDS